MNRFQTLDPDMDEREKSKLKQNLNVLAKSLIDKFGKVSSAFRAFDIRTRGAVTFADFAYVVDSLKLGLDRDILLQIFTYMDADQDNVLKYRDFCNLCAEQVLNAAPSLGDTTILRGDSSKSKASTEFSKIISQLKAKQPGRGGPNFKKRTESANNYSQAKNIEEMLGD